LDKKLVAVALIAVAGLIIAVVALSQSYFRLCPTTTPQPTVTPTTTPTATPNLTSAIPDTANYISISVTAINHAHFPNQWMPSYYVHITNNGASPLTVVSIIDTAIDDQTNFTYWSGNQEISPNATGNFSASDPYFAELPMNDIYVNYKVSGQLFVHSLAHVPLPTYPPTS
jgi:hypothetical protein